MPDWFLPSQVVADLGLKVGDNMMLDVKNNKIILRKDTK
jgi:antitoxin component of MazEF toxin-antitoxin module